MEPTTSSGEPGAPLDTRHINLALSVRAWSRSRRAQTFGLGALCGALALSLVIVVTSIFAAERDQAPLMTDDPATVSAERTPTPHPTSPVPTPGSPTEPGDQADVAPDAGPAPEQPIVQVPLPAPPPTQPPADDPVDVSTTPGNSGSAPGHTKPPKTP